MFCFKSFKASTRFLNQYKITDIMPRKNNEFMKKFMVVFIAVIMVSSVFGVIFYGYNQPSAKQEYNNYEFKQENLLWITEIDDNEFSFFYLPQEVENIQLPETTSTQLLNTYIIDMTSDEESMFNEEIALAEYTLAEDLAKIDKYARIGLTANNSYEIPVIQCNQTDYPVVYFQKSDSTGFSYGSCIMASAQQNYDILRLRDRLLYHILGIIQ
jgi:hypothetical protein